MIPADAFDDTIETMYESNNDLNFANRRKVVIVGDANAGKSRLAYVVGTNPPDMTYPPTHRGLFLNPNEYHVEVDLKETTVLLVVIDLVTGNDNEYVRSPYYMGTDVIIVCFSIADNESSPTSLKSIKDKWYQELQRYCPRVPIVLVGTKSDLRTDATVSRARGRRVMNKIKARAYVECSSVTREGLQTVFETAAEIILGLRPVQSRFARMCCRLL